MATAYDTWRLHYDTAHQLDDHRRCDELTDAWDAAIDTLEARDAEYTDEDIASEALRSLMIPTQGTPEQ